MKRDLGIMLVLFGFALLLRLLHFQQILANDPFFALPTVDPAVYHAWAQKIAAGDWFGEDVFFLGPLYPYLLGVIYSIFGPSFFVPKLLQAVVGAGTCVGVFALGRELFDRRVGIAASLLTALYGMLIFYEGSLLIATTLTALTVATTLATVRALDAPTHRRWFVAGVLIGLAALARENALLYVVGVSGWIFIAPRDDSLRERAAQAAVYLAAVLLLVGPIALRNSAIAGAPVITNSSGGIGLYISWNPDANGSFNIPRFIPPNLADTPEKQRFAYRRIAEDRLGVDIDTLSAVEVSNYWRGQALEWIVDHPGDAAALAWRKFDLFWNHYEIWNNRSVLLARPFSWVLRMPLVTWGVLVPLALAGIALSLRNARRLVPLYGMIGVYLATALLFAVLSRYRIPVVPVFAVFGGVALIGGYDAIREKSRLKLGTALLVFALSAGFVHRNIWQDDLSMAHFNLANKYKDLERWELAVPAYKRALELRPGAISFHNNLALVYERSGKYPKEAVREWRTVLRLARAQGRPKYIERATRHLRDLETVRP